MAEKDYKYQSTPTISKIKIGTGTYYIKDAEARTAIDSILADYLKAADIANKVDKETGKSLIDDSEITRLAGIKGNEDGSITADGKTVKNYDDTAVKGLISAEQTRAAGVESGLQGAIDAINNETTGILAQAKSYTDDEVAKKQDTLAFAGTDAYDKDSNKVATEKYVATEIGKLATIHIEVVDELPTSDQKENHIYLVPKGEGKTGYREYIWIKDQSKWEEIGDTDIDLTKYYNKDEIDGKVSTLNTAIDAKVAQSEYNAKVTELETADGTNATAISTEKTRAEAAEKALGDRIDEIHTHDNKAELDKINDGDVALWNAEKGANAAVKALSEGQVTTNKSNIEALQGTVGDADSGLVKDVADLKTTVGDDKAGLVKDVADLKAAGATKVEASETNGNIKINGTETTVYDDEALAGRATALENKVGDESKGLVKDVADLKAAPANGIKAEDIAAWNGEIGAKAAVGDEETRAKGAEEALGNRITSLEGQGYEVTVDSKTVNVGGQTATVTGQTINGVKATGNITGSVTIAADTATLSSSGKFTPEGSVSVTLSNATVLGSVKSAGVVPTYEHTGFSGGSLAAASTSTFAKQGILARIASAEDKAADSEVDDETLVFFDAATDTAVTAQGEYTAAVYGTDNFTAGSMPEFENATVGATASFTGEEGNLSVSGEYSKVTTGAATVTANNVELAVGSIVVADKTITTAEKEITVGKEGTYTVSKKASA